jgi:NhaP-type Na+/H+ or K+/H+ antiporter
LALRRVERLAIVRIRQSEVEQTKTAGLTKEEVAVHPDKAPAYMAEALLAFNEQLERIGEVAIVVIVGAMLSPDLLTWRVLWLTPLLFLFIRPLSVIVGLAGVAVTRREVMLSGWFGVRGVGSVYYLAYAIVHGLPAVFTDQVVGLTLAVIAASIVLHGVTVTPLMARWGENAEVVGQSR